MIEWINLNSTGNVSIKVYMTYKYFGDWVISPHGVERAFIAFEDINDALFFKIKYSL